MENKTKGIIAVSILFFLFLAFKPSLVGTTVGAIGFSNAENIWTGFGLTTQMILVVLVLIVLIALIIGKGK